MNRYTTSEGQPSFVEPSVLLMVALGIMLAPLPCTMSLVFLEAPVARLGSGAVSCSGSRPARLRPPMRADAVTAMA